MGAFKKAASAGVDIGCMCMPGCAWCLLYVGHGDPVRAGVWQACVGGEVENVQRVGTEAAVCVCCTNTCVFKSLSVCVCVVSV